MPRWRKNQAGRREGCLRHSPPVLEGNMQSLYQRPNPGPRDRIAPHQTGETPRRSLGNHPIHGPAITPVPYGAWPVPAAWQSDVAGGLGAACGIGFAVRRLIVVLRRQPVSHRNVR